MREADRQLVDMLEEKHMREVPEVVVVGMRTAQEHKAREHKAREHMAQVLVVMWTAQVLVRERAARRVLASISAISSMGTLQQKTDTI